MDFCWDMFWVLLVFVDMVCFGYWVSFDFIVFREF